MNEKKNVIWFRVRYSETDQMGTFYNARALEWFECGRTEYLRNLGLPYTGIEAEGVYLPLTEAHVQFLGRAQYDDLLEMTTMVSMIGKLRIRFDEIIVHADSRAEVVKGYTIHTFTHKSGKPIRPPEWITDLLQKHMES